MPFRIVVYTAAARSHNVERTVAELARRHPDAEILVLEHRPAKPAKKLLRNQWRNLKRHGWRWIPYQSAEMAEMLFKRRKRHPGSLARSRPKAAPADRIIHTIVPSVNAPDCVALVRDWAPDLGVALSAPIIRERQFALPRLGTINIHKGRLPHFRGMPPAFWELWHGETEVGVTVHRIESGLDTGPVLLEESIAVEPHSTAAGLRVRLDAIGTRLMANAVDSLRAGTGEFRPQHGEGRSFTRPTLKQEQILARKNKQANAGRAAKNAVFAGYGMLGRFTPAYGNRLVVLLYHRVNDSQRDSVTIGVEQFDTHMRYLADHYRIVSIGDLVKGDVPGDGPLVAVSFDDGYLDNYQYAAPILIKHGVNATFFISTDNVSHNLPFAHDLEKIGHGLDAMTWDQVREMHREGLEFGSHTANHINLAASPADLVAAELVRSKQALEQELGLSEVMFAYPFGKRADITPERLEQVRQAGYVCNCSAYGGVNSLAPDIWDIRRQGVDHTFDPAALRAKIAGWKANALV